ncbi:unnamed protein product [Orchesella dallaii]|uniref:Uncharacterized protein n=1 Tax=Orchesella dallaii TaxID=48710 RepID=A0ABP1QYQ8_9HEXA
MPDCNSNDCNHHQLDHSSQLKNSSSAGGLVPSSTDQAGLVSSFSSSSSRSIIVDGSCSCSSSVPVVDGGSGGGFGAAEQEGGGDSVCSLFPSSCRRCLCKMFTCRVLIGLLLVKCLILSLVIPAHLSPTTASSEYPPPAPPDYSDNEVGGSHGESADSHQMMSAGDEDGQPVSPSESNAVDEHAPPPLSSSDDVTDAPAADADDNNEVGDANGDGDGDGDDGNDNDEATTEAAAPEPSDQETDADNESEPATKTDGDGDGDDGATESQVEDAVEAAEASQASSESGTAGASTSTETTTSEDTNGGSCSGNGNSDESMKTVLEKIESLMDAVKNIDNSIDKMETLVQSTMIEERVFKCVAAISSGNQTQALKYWKQIQRYLSTPQKQAAVMNQLIRDSYGGSEEHILPVIQFIDGSTQYYGYYTLFKELPKYDQLYRNTAIFTLGHYAKKSCGLDSTLYKSLPSAVQSVFSDFFTLQNKHNKGYLYYAKRCVAKHYYYCLDVLTKKIDPYILDGLAEDSEEKKRFHWKLNATDSTVTKFFILNHDKYWTYRLQSLNNSPRFKMEEAGSNAEIELSHFQFKLHTDDELMIKVRQSEDYLEEEDYKSENTEVRLHSFHKTDGIPDSPRMFWLVSPVSSSATGNGGAAEPDTCNIELASVASNNGNGNGSSK